MEENPRRPPKKWMRDCVRGASSSARNPGAVCGALWYHKMSAAERRAALAREGKALDNAPVDTGPAGTLLAIGIAAVAVVGLVWAMKKDDSTSSSAPAPTSMCASYDDVKKFSQATGYHVWFVDAQAVATWKPPNPQFTSDPLARAYSQVDCGFYRFSEGVWVPDAATNQQFKDFRAGGQVVLSGHPALTFSVGFRDRKS